MMMMIRVSSIGGADRGGAPLHLLLCVFKCLPILSLNDDDESESIGGADRGGAPFLFVELLVLLLVLVLVLIVCFQMMMMKE